MAEVRVISQVQHKYLVRLLGCCVERDEKLLTWELWKNNDPLKLVDPAITVDPCIRSQILKCIHLGLLCVQHYAEDRPTMTILVSMLDVNNTMELPYPKQPGHLQVRPPSSNNEALRSHQENGSSVYIMQLFFFCCKNIV
ncbi:Cysteine-rich receptor-like protein kinase 10 [Bienertia sinuspersici]